MALTEMTMAMLVLDDPGLRADLAGCRRQEFAASRLPRLDDPSEEPTTPTAA